MARVTVEDCEEKVGNRFDLVLTASQRARQISGGSPALIEEDSDKCTVVALREIANSKITPTDLNEALVKSYQRTADVSTPEEVSTMIAEEEIITDSAEKILINNGFIIEEDVAAPSMFEDVADDELVD